VVGIHGMQQHWPRAAAKMAASSTEISRVRSDHGADANEDVSTFSSGARQHGQDGDFLNHC
jgi:hypothetical protein